MIPDPDASPQDGDYVLAKIQKLPDAIFRQNLVRVSGNFLYALDSIVCDSDTRKKTQRKSENLPPIISPGYGAVESFNRTKRD